METACLYLRTASAMRASLSLPAAHARASRGFSATNWIWGATPRPFSGAASGVAGTCVLVRRFCGRNAGALAARINETSDAPLEFLNTNSAFPDGGAGLPWRSFSGLVLIGHRGNLRLLGCWWILGYVGWGWRIFICPGSYFVCFGRSCRIRCQGWKSLKLSTLKSDLNLEYLKYLSNF